MSESSWMPIDSAPKDGTTVLLYAPPIADWLDWYTEVGYYVEETQCWTVLNNGGAKDYPAGDGLQYDFQPPTHWQALFPLPHETKGD